MKKFVFSFLILLLALLLFAACGSDEQTTQSNDKVTSFSPTSAAPSTTAIPTTAATTESLPHTAPVTKPQDSTALPSNTAPQSSQKPQPPVTPSAVCLNELDKMAVKAVAFEKLDLFSGDVGITYVFNDNANELDQTVIEGMDKKTVFASVNINGSSYRVTDYKREGVYLRLDVEKAGALLVAGVSYAVSLEFHNADNALLYYSYSTLLATPVSTKKQPERTPLTSTLPSEGLNQVSVNKDALSATGFVSDGGSSLASLFDQNNKTKFSGKAEETVPTIFFSLNQAETLTHYTVYTANDAATYPDRNPAGWRLYGKVGDMWMLLSRIENNATYETGLKATNTGAFSYAITLPRECKEYKIEFVFADLSMQLGEITLYTTEGFSVSTPDPNAGSLLNDMQGVDVSLSGFRLNAEMQNHVGVAYHFTSKDALADTVRQGLLSGDMFATVTLDDTVYQIIDHIWNGTTLYLDLQSAGAPVFSNVSYSVTLTIYKASGERLYYTIPTAMSSAYQTPNLPDRVGLNITLPNNLTQVKVNSSSVQTENILHWGDGAPTQLFDGNTTSSKIGGNVESGEFTLTFKLTSAATLTYYTFYTGNDTSTHPDRNPISWSLYGKIDCEYVLLDEVRETGAAHNGLEGVNATAYSYKIENPQNCSEYMIVFQTGTMFQLNEMILYK